MRDALIKLQDEYEQVALNQISRFEPGLTPEQFETACAEIVTNLKMLRLNIEKILNEHLYPKLDNIESISDEDEGELYTLAQKLSSFETRQDPGLAFKVYTALLNWARLKKDDAKTLKYLYWCGITRFFFYGQNDEMMLTFFEEGAAYASKYDSFEDPEIRQYVHRCLGNVSMVLYNSEPLKAIAKEESNFNFWNKLIFAGKDPDFPWLNYFLNGYNHRFSYLTRLVHKDPEAETKEKLKEILDVSITMNKLYHKNMEYYGAFGGSRYDYQLWEAQFLAGLISFDNLIENVDKKKAEIAPDDYSPDAMYIKVQMNSYLLFYVSKLSRLKHRKDEIIAKVSEDTIEYLSRIPNTVSTETLNTYLRSLAGILSAVYNPEEQFNFILRMTTFRHIMTYAHSIMVGKVAVLLAEKLIETSPAGFIGCLDITCEDDVKAMKKELKEFADMSGLCHDIGKTGCIDNPYMHIRVLTDEEYELIKGHPNEGVSLLTRDDGVALNEGYVEVIAGHHKYYDNSAGYPDDFNISTSKHNMMIDIISVANSIVAATDQISKTYDDPKSLEDVIGEIKAESGVRYSPTIAEVLDDEDVFSSIKQILEEESLNAYYTAYLYAWSGGKHK